MKDKSALCVWVTVLSLGFVWAVEGSPAESDRFQRGGRVPEVEFTKIKPEKAFRDSVEADSLRYACAQSEPGLKAFFTARGLLFESKLVRKLRGRDCHIYYEPTIPGFRADADNLPITDLYVDIDALNFLVRRSDRSGYTLDIIKSILDRVQRPLTVSIGMAKMAEDEFYEGALQFHFPDTIHQIILRQIEATEGNPWVQDYLKAGKRAGERILLVTHDLYEGQHANGSRFRALLDGMKTRPFARSKLSWEGGDLQFLQHPQDPSKLILFYGTTAGRYWGKSLTPNEFEYVLRVEFGADQAVDLSDLTPHVDYFVSFLPQEKIALVSTAVTGDLQVARDALRLLKEKFASYVPAEILEIEKILQGGEPAASELKKALRQAREKQEDWAFPVNSGLFRALQDYFETVCGGTLTRCVDGGALSVQRQRELLRADPEFLRDWAVAAMTGWSTQEFISSYLAVIESQFTNIPSDKQKRVEDRIRELESLGLRVIRVPRVAGEQKLGIPWSGVSYVNNLLIDNLLFIPTFGLTSLETKLLESLERQLPESYRVIPIVSQHMIVHNGAIHCTVALVRD